MCSDQDVVITPRCTHNIYKVLAPHRIEVPETSPNYISNLPSIFYKADFPPQTSAKSCSANIGPAVRRWSPIGIFWRRAASSAKSVATHITTKKGRKKRVRENVAWSESGRGRTHKTDDLRFRKTNRSYADKQTRTHSRMRALFRCFRFFHWFFSSHSGCNIQLSAYTHAASTPMSHKQANS